MIIGSGAEAYIELAGEQAKKIRPQKTYRHPELDKKLRQFRTRREAKILERLTTLAPKLIGVDDKEMVIAMEFVDAPQVRDVINKKNSVELAKKIGITIKELHEAGVVHGDLTTSNMLYREKKIILIDFGLSAFSTDIEDQAVDLHLLMHSLHAKHPELPLWETVLSAYNPSKELEERLEEVELRGRYKKKG